MIFSARLSPVAFSSISLTTANDPCPRTVDWTLYFLDNGVGKMGVPSDSVYKRTGSRSARCNGFDETVFDNRRPKVLTHISEPATESVMQMIVKLLSNHLCLLPPLTSNVMA